MTFEELKKCVPDAIESEWHQHSNGGGWVQNTASVGEATYLNPHSIVSGTVKIGVDGSEGRYVESVLFWDEASANPSGVVNGSFEDFCKDQMYEAAAGRQAIVFGVSRNYDGITFLKKCVKSSDTTYVRCVRRWLSTFLQSLKWDNDPLGH